MSLAGNQAKPANAGSRKLYIIRNGVLFLEVAKQSIWYPYVQKSETDNNNEGKNVNKRKKHESVLAICRLLVNDFYISRKEMAGICGISLQEVSAALKKLRKKISEGHVIIGLSDKENDTLLSNLTLRESYQKSMEDVQLKEVASLILENYQMAGKEMAERLNEPPMAISRSLSKIRNRTDLITGLSEEENAKVKNLLEKREREQEIEKERRAKEREMAKANKEAMKDQVVAADKKRVRKKPATISKEGLAEWNMMHYDKSGMLKEELRDKAPGDLPLRYPRKKIAVRLRTPDSNIIPAPIPKGSGTRAGRRRNDYLRLF